jgi:hypothetical protein
MDLYIWIKDEHNQGTLILKESNVTSNSQNTIHMLYTDGATHFNLLSESEDNPKVRIVNTGHDEKGGYERDSKDEKETQDLGVGRIPAHRVGNGDGYGRSAYASVHMPSNSSTVGMPILPMMVNSSAAPATSNSAQSAVTNLTPGKK